MIVFRLPETAKKLLDEGGDTFARTVLAKKASIDASEVDKSIATRVQVAIVKLDDSVAKLKAFQPAQLTEVSTVKERFFLLGNDHETTLKAYIQIGQLLQTPASSAEMSLEEMDALAILHAKMGCATMMGRTVESFENVRQKALASMASVSAEQSGEGERVPAVSSATTQRPTLLQGLHSKAHSGLELVKQTASDRVATAKAGKSLLDDGGDSVARAVVAKKACLDAAGIDRDVAQRVQSAIALFDDSAAQLRALTPARESEGLAGHRDLAKLADEHELRANMYRQIADMLQAPAASVEMSFIEWDALALVNVKDSCGALQCRTNEGFEAVKGMVFSGCTSGVEQLDERRRMACA